MSREASPTTGRPYGVQRICTTCQFPRSTLYAQEQRAAAPQPPQGKRGPKPTHSDEQLLELIRADLKQSPFSGEGHRKVWARLKYGLGVCVSRKRILRIMREHNLLRLQPSSRLVVTRSHRYRTSFEGGVRAKIKEFSPRWRCLQEWGCL